MSATGAAWEPYWAALTDYSVDAVVLPTTFAGYLWRCTTAGTSGAAEPSWPDPITTSTYTVADGTVTWTVTSGAIQALQAGIVATCTTFMNANPTIVRKVLTVRPKSYDELPVLYLGEIRESITVTSGYVYRREFEIDLVYVDTVPDSEQYNSRSNFVRDALIVPLIRDVHSMNPRGITQPSRSAEPRDETLGQDRYPVVVWTITGYLTEGVAA